MMRYIKIIMSKVINLLSIQINAIGKNVSTVYEEIDLIFKQLDQINLNTYTKIIKEECSDLFMMVFYCLRKVTKLIDDCVNSKIKHKKTINKDRLANAKFVHVRFTSVDIKQSTVLRSARKNIIQEDHYKRLPRIDV